jgi:hypothetical protein
MKRKQCITKRILKNGDIRLYDNFTYSDQHRGWICKKCLRALDKAGGTDEIPEILKK